MANLSSVNRTNTRHLRFGASTLMREKIYPSDPGFYSRQVTRGSLPRRQDIDEPVTTTVVEELIAFAGQTGLAPKQQRHGVTFNPGSVLQIDQVKKVRENKKRRDEEHRLDGLHAIRNRWGRKYGFREEEVLELENKFNRYDADGSGFIDLEECSCIVDDLNILDDSIAKGHKSKRRAVLKRMIDELDRTMSGTLNFIQFMDLIKRVREGSIEDFLPGCGSPRAASSPRPPSASRRRPQSASPVVTFRPHRTMENRKIANVRAKRAAMLKKRGEDRLKEYIKRSAKRMGLSEEETKKALGLSRQVLGADEETRTSHLHVIHSPRSYRRKPKKRFVSLVDPNAPKRRGSTVSGGYAIRPPVLSDEKTGVKKDTHSSKRFETNYYYDKKA